MAADPDDLASENQLDEILTAYLKSLDDGQTPDRAGLLARYPVLAAELAEFFDEQDRLDRWAEPLRPVARAARLETPTAEATVDGIPAAPEPVGSFGEYELLRVLGHGGMGVVYEARHRPLNRVVALKMIPAGRWASETEVQRFRNEAEAVAHLDHPNIVPIYDVGEHDGQPYFAMKLIEGGGLAPTGVRGQGSGVRDQTPREAARLVAAVARAVHHAHQRGILHRDLKPSNVLLDKDGNPYVTDFGLAKRLRGEPGALATGDLTQSGALVGTPGYVAPEQATGAKGSATVASDVYGLGAILYALLTGGPPFRGEDLLDTLEQVCHREPEPPRKNNPRVDRDLELICLKCLEKDPRRRYPSSETLAEELERYLDGRPLACTRPVGGAERLWRWYRRNAVLASLGAAAAVALVAVAVVSVVASIRLKAANDQERESRDKAVESRKFAVDTVNKYVQRVLTDTEFRARGLERFRKVLLTDAKELYEQLTRMEGGDPAVEAQRGQAYWALARITEELGSRQDALPLFQRGRAIFEQLHRDHPEDPAHQFALADMLHDLGHLYQLTARWDESAEMYRLALPLRQDLADRHAGEPRYQDGLARTLSQIGSLHFLQGREAEAVKYYEKAFTILERLAAAAPQDPGQQDRLAKVRLNLGLLYRKTRFAVAEEHFSKALAIRERLARDYPLIPDHADQFAITLLSRGTQYRQTRRFAKAQADYDRALPIRERLADEHPDVPGYRHELARLVHARGMLEVLLRKWREAEASFQEALALSAPVVKENRDVAGYRDELGAILYDTACLYSLESAAVRKDTALPPEARKERAEALAGRAIEMLCQARAAGFFSAPAHLELLRRVDTDLVPIRPRKDFRELLNEIDKEAAGRKMP
jgi:tetratricopeptide (TPR) repeat protein